MVRLTERHLQAFMVVMLLAVMGLAWAVWHMANVSPPYDPFGEYPPQSVTAANGARVEHAEFGNATLPWVVATADDVQVESVKCLADDITEPVAVAYQTSWRFVDPPGFTFVSGEGVTTRLPGCQQFGFINPVPVEVSEQAGTLFGAGHDHVVVQLTGTETPIDADGRLMNNAVVQTWQTENFALVPEEL